MDLLLRRRMTMAPPVREGYIIFADPVVEQICATNWGDGVGITPSQAAAVTNSQFGTTFRGNTTIVSFDELEYFTGLTQIPAQAFDGCTALTNIVLPNAISSIGAYAFRNCTNLQTSLVLPNTLTTIGSQVFSGCTSLVDVTIPSSVTSIGNYLFQGGGGTGTLTLNLSGSFSMLAWQFGSAGFTRLIVNAGLTALADSSFRFWSRLTYVDLPSTITSIGNAAFNADNALLTFIIRATTPPTLAATTAILNLTNLKMYVPYSADHSILNAYKAATNWSTYASKMYELNPDGTVPTS